MNPHPQGSVLALLWDERETEHNNATSDRKEAEAYQAKAQSKLADAKKCEDRVASLEAAMKALEPMKV